jgi:hypothetical protein
MITAMFAMASLRLKSQMAFVLASPPSRNRVLIDLNNHQSVLRSGSARRSLTENPENDKVRPIKATCIIVLLALLVCYNLDLECLLESQSCQRATPSAHAELDSSSSRCSQPTTLTVVVAILPPQTKWLLPAPITVELVRSPEFEPELARVSYLLVPLGLRAPPAA